MQTENDTRSYLTVALVTAGLGLLAGFLIAPMSGRDARTLARRRFTEVKDKSYDAFERAKTFVGGRMSRGKAAVAEFAAR